MEEHRLQKEVNFSECSVNAHGWFSYLIKVKPHVENVIKILLGSSGVELAVGITGGSRAECRENTL